MWTGLVLLGIDEGRLTWQGSRNGHLIQAMHGTSPIWLMSVEGLLLLLLLLVWLFLHRRRRLHMFLLKWLLVLFKLDETSHRPFTSPQCLHGLPKFMVWSADLVSQEHCCLLALCEVGTLAPRKPLSPLQLLAR